MWYIGFMNTAEKIRCPNCNTEIDVNKVIYHEIAESVLKEKESEFAKRLEAEKTIARDQSNRENEDTIKSLQKTLKEKSDQVIEFNKTKSENEKLKIERDEIEFKVTAAKDAELAKKLKDERESYKSLIDTERERFKKEAAEENTLVIAELKKKLEDQNVLVEEMKRKAEQGSMQLQGEVQELVIEDILRDAFRFDIIEPVPKGINGADVIQKVRGNTGNEAGVIAYESKRTKAFNREWIAKLKEDGARVKADLCVLVTETLPEDIGKIGQKDGVWICAFADFRGLALVLRDSLIRIKEAFSSQTNRGEKMQMLYDYLTGREFSSQIMTVLESFSELQNGYIDERNKMERIWKAREKQLEKIMLNTNIFIGSIKGIAGSSLAGIPLIEDGGPRKEIEDR